MSWSTTINRYAQWGIDLILLDPFAERQRDRGKKPKDAGWPERKYSRSELLLHTIQGGLHNLGARLREQHLVLDVDPRNGGDGSLKRLCADLKMDLQNVPFVITGGGGRHYYFAKRSQGAWPASIELSAYPGVEYKSKGAQVVTPGSVHPFTNQPYVWGLYIPELPLAPDPLMSLLVASRGDRACDLSGVGAITPEELAEILSQMPPEKYADNDSWFRVLAAAYHATGGAGLPEFMTWSTSDPSYSDHENIISARWKSLERPADSKRSLGSLIYELKKCNGKIPASLCSSRAEELAEFVPELSAEAAGAKVSKLTSESSAGEIMEALKYAVSLSPLEQADVMAGIRDKTGRTKTELAETVRHLKKEKKRENSDREDQKLVDVSYDIAHQVLDTQFKGGTLVRGLDGQYWRYSGTHWQPYSSDELKGLIKAECEAYRALNPSFKFQISSTIVASEVVIRAEVSKGADLLGANRAPAPVINCSNCELWLERDGSFATRRHSPGSFLTYCLPLAYSPEAECPLLNETLAGIFEPLPDGNDVVRHFWEVLGYTLQPNKTIPAWFLFYGHGSNGKSLLLDVMLSLLGPAGRSIASISELSPTKSEFALSECVGALAIVDDDVKRDTVLNDDILKKLSEAKELRARQLYGQKFTFRNCATVFLAANNWPQTRDLSDGMMRRAYGFPFANRFKHDDNRKERIIRDELPGALVKALEGLRRLRERGTFDVPASCKGVIDEWKTHSNQALAYLAECHDSGHWQGRKDFEVLWEGYDHWAQRNRVKRTYTLYNFRDALVSYGLRIENNLVKGLDA